MEHDDILRMRRDGEVEGLVLALQAEGTDLRMAAAAGLAELGRFALPFLTDALMKDNPSLRMWAAYTLGLMGDVRAVPALTCALEDGDEGVAKWASAALARIRDSREGCGRCKFC
jgi:hypothetical protein